MIVVADTSPLNYLILLGHVELLSRTYGNILVPFAVLAEMRHPDAPSEVRTWATTPPSWIEAVHIHNIDATLPEELGMGERHAISLAAGLKADMLLIDDWAGRQEATARNIQVAGTLAVLLQHCLEGHLEFAEVIVRLGKYGFRASPPLIASMLARYERARSRQ